MRVTGYNTLMTRFSGARTRHLRYPTNINVRTLNVSSLKECRGRKSTSVGGSGFSDVCMLSERESYGAGEGIISVTLALALLIAPQEESEEKGLEEEE